MQERSIPEAALRDPNSIEMLRVWIAEKKLHCSMKVGMYQETMKVPEEVAWGTILADVARHLANALHEGYGHDKSATLRRISDKFLDEIDKSTSAASGGFVSKQ
mgnify:CR=1 FL=1|jgi:hypothetical protein